MGGRDVRLCMCYFILMLMAVGCQKDSARDSCNGAVPAKAEFFVRENLSDTAFIADTVFRDNYVTFEAIGSYYSTVWSIGSDPREFTPQSFTLSFANFLGTVDINLTGKDTPYTKCFPSDNGVYPVSKKLTIVEQVQKPNLTLSPIVGSYKGVIKNLPRISLL